MSFLRSQVLLQLILLIIQISCLLSFHERPTLRISCLPSIFQRKISRIAFNPSSKDNILNTSEEIAKSFLLSKQTLRERSHKTKSLSNVNFQLHLLVFTLLMLPVKIIYEMNSFKMKIVTLMTSTVVIGFRRKDIINRFKEFRMKMLAQAIVEETIKDNESFIPAYDSTINSFNDDVKVYKSPDIDQDNENNLIFSSVLEENVIISPEPSSPDLSSNILTSTSDIEFQPVSKDSSLNESSNFLTSPATSIITSAKVNHSDADGVITVIEQDAHDETTRNRVVMQMLTGALAGTVVGGPVGGVVATAVTATIIYEKERQLKEQQNLEQSNTNEQEEQAYS